jgi:putative Holliday junction resolvase
MSATAGGSPATSAGGVWLAVDVGSVRVGVARSDPRGTLALPLVTLRRDARTDRDVDELANLVSEYAAVGVVVGLPRTLRGQEGAAAAAARDYAGRLAPRIAPVAIHFLDERLTTVSAQRKLQQSGVRSRAGRAVIDQAAAVELLEHWLDTRRAMLRHDDAVGHAGQQRERAARDADRPE